MALGNVNLFHHDGSGEAQVDKKHRDLGMRCSKVISVRWRSLSSAADGSWRGVLALITPYFWSTTHIPRGLLLQLFKQMNGGQITGTSYLVFISRVAGHQAEEISILSAQHHAFQFPQFVLISILNSVKKSCFRQSVPNNGRLANVATQNFNSARRLREL